MDSFRFHLMSFILPQFEKKILLFAFTHLTATLSTSLCHFCVCQIFAFKKTRHDPSARASKDTVRRLLVFGTAGSNSDGNIVSIVHCQKFVRRAYHSSRGVLMNVVCHDRDREASTTGKPSLTEDLYQYILEYNTCQ